MEGNFALFAFHFALKLCFTFLALAFFLYLLINNRITMVSLCMRHFRHYSNESTDLPDIYCTRSKNVRDFTLSLCYASSRSVKSVKIENRYGRGVIEFFLLIVIFKDYSRLTISRQKSYYEVKQF